MFGLRLRYWLLVVAVVGFCAAYVFYWRALAREVERGFEEWTVARIAEGYDIRFDSYRVEGFPGRIELTVERPMAADPRHHAAWSWAAERVRALAQPWNLRHVIVDLGQSHGFGWDQDGERRTLKVTANSAKASFRMRGPDSIERAAADLLGLSISGDGLAQPVAVQRLQVHQRLNGGEDKDRPAGSFNLSVEAEKTALPPDQSGPLGPDLRQFNATFLLAPPLPKGPDDIVQWRDQGGSVDVTNFALAWGPLDMRGNGTLSLDKQMRLLAALSSEVRGFKETINALAEAGRMRPNVARTAQQALDLMARPGSDGKPTLTVPITAQDGRLYVGPLELMELGPVPMIGRRAAQN